ncbi:hypothetical protein CCACVL1_17544 [Corchorus capsularis]|uniref:Uncharacterized protein n=1 Tax=Corchorus capsularis TaxID=210143 RepID=A0A1R3HRH7_COCAP|nr:hypothetical protein CCACVL1_17544 [Corchorus capsularis]
MERREKFLEKISEVARYMAMAYGWAYSYST